MAFLPWTPTDFNEGNSMTEALNNVTIEPVTGLAYRVRPAQVKTANAPCLLLLHGVGSNESGFIELARQMDPRLVVILLRGPLVLAPGRFAWFQVSFTPSGPAIDAAQAECARALLLDFIGQLPASHGVDPERIWIAGFSQGGIMSASVALTAPDSVAGFGVLSGRILQEILPQVRKGPALGKVQAFVSHGVHDQTLGIHFAYHARQVLTELEVPLTYTEYVAGHALDGAMIGDFQRWLGSQLDSNASARDGA
jgi:phospholipase/carboxylesterase